MNSGASEAGADQQVVPEHSLEEQTLKHDLESQFFENILASYFLCSNIVVGSFMRWKALLLHLEEAVKNEAVKNVPSLPTKQAPPKQLFLSMAVHMVLEVQKFLLVCQMLDFMQAARALLISHEDDPSILYSLFQAKDGQA